MLLHSQLKKREQKLFSLFVGKRKLRVRGVVGERFTDEGKRRVDMLRRVALEVLVV